MRHRSLKIYLFAGYLVLLLNLGPSLHKSHFFGLHSHEAATTESGISQSCCCTTNDDSSLPQHSREPAPQSESVGSYHDCSLCKFFDQYNVIAYAPEFSVLKRKIQFHSIEFPHRAFSEAIAVVARGPPRI